MGKKIVHCSNIINLGYILSQHPHFITWMKCSLYNYTLLGGEKVIKIGVMLLGRFDILN